MCVSMRVVLLYVMLSLLCVCDVCVLFGRNVECVNGMLYVLLYYYSEVGYEVLYGVVSGDSVYASDGDIVCYVVCNMRIGMLQLCNGVVIPATNDEYGNVVIAIIKASYN